MSNGPENRNRRADDSSLNRLTNHTQNKWWWIWIGLAGGFGGTAPNLFSLGTHMMQGDPLPTASYFIGLIIFAFMGAGLVLSFREDDVKKALFLGLSLPAMFQSSIGAVSEHANEVIAAGFSTPAIIEEAPRTFVIIPQGTDGHPSFRIVFVSQDGKRRDEQIISAREITKEPPPNIRLDVPTWAVTAQLVYRSSQSPPVKLTGAPEQAFYVVAERSFWSGIKQVAGVRGVSEYTIELFTKAEFEKRKQLGK